jgi:hypothetical protein
MILFRLLLEGLGGVDKTVWEVVPEAEGAEIWAIFRGAVHTRCRFAGIRNGKEMSRYSVGVQRINTCWVKSTYANAHGSSSIPTNPDEAPHLISSDFPLWVLLYPSCCFFF